METKAVQIGNTTYTLLADNLIESSHIDNPLSRRRYILPHDEHVFTLFYSILGKIEARGSQMGWKSPGILQDWVIQMGLRHQGCLLGAIRGCDGTPKEDPSKPITRFLRACVLRAHVGDVRKSVSFMQWIDSPLVFQGYARGFLNDFDRYPNHYVFHLLHASHILGRYFGPDPDWPIRDNWLWFYEMFCKKMHVHPESKEEMDARLNKNEKDFGRDQKL